MSRKKKISQQERVFAQLQDQLQLRRLGGILGGFGRKIRWVDVPKKTCCNPR